MSFNKDPPLCLENSNLSISSEKSEISQASIESESNEADELSEREIQPGRLSLLQLSVHSNTRTIKGNFKFKSRDLQTIKLLCETHFNEVTAEMVLIKEKTAFDILEEYNDKYPLFELRKALKLIFIFFRYCCTQIVTTSLFEYFMVCVILSNTVLIALEYSSSSESDFIEAFYLYVYTTEFALKIFGLGIISSSNAYFRDLWNILDFAILLFGWISFSNSGTLNLYTIRTIRIFRIFRSVSSIEGLRIIFISLCGSLAKLYSSIVLLFIFCLILAVAGVQIFMSLWSQRCMELETGLVSSSFCGSEKCELGFVCVDSLDNPNYGNSNFDNTAYALLTVFQCITLEGWSELLKISVYTTSPISTIYFVLVTFIGAFVLTNLALAIIKASFTETISKIKGRNLEVDSEKSILKQKNFKVDDGFEDKEQNSNFLSEVKKAQENLIIKVSDPSENEEFGIDQKKENGGIILSNDLGNVVERKRISILKPDFKFSNTMHLKHGFLENFRLGKINKKYKIVIDIEERLVVGSVNDMKEPPVNVEILTYFKYTGYSFVYHDQSHTDYDKLQIAREQEVKAKYKSGKLQVFRFLSNWRSKKVAFFTVIEPVSSFIKSQENDFRLNQHVIGGWSGTEINQLSDTNVEKLRYIHYHCWGPGLIGIYQKLVFPLKTLVNSKSFNKLMTLMVLLNTLILSIDHYGLSQKGKTLLNLFNFILTIIFSAEVFLKVIANGPIHYSRDKMNLFDLCIVVLSILELIFLSPSGSKFSALRIVRVFRLFRVLRVARMFRYFQSLVRILKAIGRSITKILYLFILLLIFIIIFSLLGAQIFSGKFNFSNGTPRSNFDGFHEAFITTWQVLTLENWQEILYNGMRSEAGAFSCFFFIAWIIIGNFILLNLFIAIMLDSFTEDSLSIIKNERKFRVRQSAMIEVESSLGSEIGYKSETDRLKEDIFKDIECDKSFFVFSKKNGIRRFSYYFTSSIKFEKGIVIVIIFSTVKLIWDTYIIDYPRLSLEQRISFALDLLFNVLFFFEFLLKAIKIGFCFDKESYLRDMWNIVDFSIVILSFVDIAASYADVQFLKFLRLLRTLRPLRLLSHNISMKIIVAAMAESLLSIFNVLIVMVFIILIFAIMGVSLFGGMFYSCSNNLITEKNECLSRGFSWDNSDYNFDNVFEAVATLFIITTQEGWPDIMHMGMDVVDPEHSPKRNSFKYGAYYFLFYILIGSFFLLNMFMAVIFQKFTEAKLRETSLIGQGLTKDQQVWVELQKLAVESKPNIEVSSPPSNCIRKPAYLLISKDQFEYCISFFILLNFVVISMNYRGASKSYELGMYYVSIIINSVFIFEAILKITGMGFRDYFKSGWNKFDFLTVIVSIIGIIVENLNEINAGVITDTSKLIRLIRIVRIFRLLKVIKFLATISEIISIISYSLPAILNVLSLMMLIFLIYSVLGVLLFRNVNTGARIDSFYNFSTFHSSILLLYRMTTGEDWYLIMFDCFAVAGQAVSYLYFFTFIIFTSLLLLNLFIMVILQNYEEFESKTHSAINLFNDIIKVFRKVWENYSVNYQGFAIKHTDLIEFLYELGPNYGFPRYVQRDSIIRKLAALNLHIDPSGYICYNDLLYVVIKRLYKIKIQGNTEFRVILDRTESIAQKSLKKKQESTMKKLIKDRNVISATNFFYTLIRLKSIFKAWSKLSDKGSKSGNSYSDVEYPGDISVNSENSLDVTYLKQ